MKGEQKIGDELLHVCLVRVFYPLDPPPVDREPIGEVFQFGQTWQVSTRASGDVYSDEDAPKKSVTDALGKALSMLGFSADVYLGMWDDNKYVTDRKREAEERAVEKAKTAAPDLPEKVKTALDEALSAAERLSTKDEVKRFKEETKDLYKILAGIAPHWGNQLVKAVEAANKRIE
jgi:hypothetical protein